MKKTKDPVTVEVRSVAYATAIRCLTVQPAVELTIGIKGLMRLVEAAEKALSEMGLADAASAAAAFVKAVPTYIGKDDPIQLRTFANADAVFPEVKKDLNAYVASVLDIKSRRAAVAVSPR